jgi:anti-sigma28 factor (negative regulator of flagellin synthesis)
MTVLALRYPTRDQRPAALDSTRSRFGRGSRVSSSKQDARTAKLDDIKARLEGGAYTVDAAKVADAIVERLLAGRSVKDTGSTR